MLRRIFFTQTAEAPRMRRFPAILAIMSMAAAGGAAGYALAPSIAPPAAPEEPAVHEVVIEGMVSNIVGLGTMTYDVAMAIEGVAHDGEDLDLRDQAVEAGKAAGTVPLVRLGDDPIASFERIFFEDFRQRHDTLKSIDIRDAKIFQRGP